MSEPRVIALCVAVGLTALVINSVAAFIAGREPAIFGGATFLVLLAAWLTCWAAVIIAARRRRIRLREQAEDYRIAVALIQWGLQESGSWQRPSVD